MHTLTKHNTQILFILIIQSDNDPEKISRIASVSGERRFLFREMRTIPKHFVDNTCRSRKVSLGVYVAIVSFWIDRLERMHTTLDSFYCIISL